MRHPAFMIVPGDLVDLEGDPLADPRHDDVYLQSQYAEVVGVEQETPRCVRIDFEGRDSVGFPSCWLINVVGGRAVEGREG